ncbi:TrmB family transcriptional regulator [Halobellus limi]|uniref:Sugar-specific transcriptional regulator TrmB n=1 Tax=Halobellus limi TaxID=699433 RepID=A0A1H6AI00_9EURY|nr:helix-turn-helix domain-containing protein [Halobellus limi]QCC47582.1 TrmB family transcriptional regulator [Halobellus limi]SEG47774.1 Sugar-specific transcriptional regulator TrmB [Halobellus limi]
MNPADAADVSDVSEHDAVAALERLGLSNYAARVFVALQRLGVGTARQIHEDTEVPRSQVYGAAEELTDLGLVELQQSTPKRYRPVDLDTARRQLAEALKSEADRAFSFLRAQRSARSERETRDDVWTTRGREPINGRVTELARQATDTVLFAAPDPAFVPDDLIAVLEARVDDGVSVRVVSESPAVRETFSDVAGVEVDAAMDSQPMEYTGRVLLVDDRAVLLSAVSPTEAAEETAIWSADTAMADILVRAIAGNIDSFVRDGDAPA